MEFSLVLYSFLIPTLFGAGLLALAWLLPPLRRFTRLQGVMFAVALAAGLSGSYFAESGLPVLPPTRSDNWLGWIGPGMIIAAFLAMLNEKRPFPWLELGAVLLGAAVACMPILSHWFGGTLKPLFPGMDGSDQVMLGMVVTLAAILMARLEEVRPGGTIPCALAFAFTGSSLTALASGWITMAIFFGVVAAISGAAGLIGRFGGSPSLGRGSAFAAVLPLVILPVACWCKTTPPDDLHWWYWLLLAGSPLLLLPCENRWFNRMPGTAAFWTRFVISALPVIYVLIKVGPMIVGESSDGTNELEDMMKMYE